MRRITQGDWTALSVCGWWGGGLHEGSVCTDSNQESQVACRMKLHGFYISSAIWVLLPEHAMNTTVTGRRRREPHFTQQLFLPLTHNPTIPCPESKSKSKSDICAVKSDVRHGNRQNGAR